MAVSQFKRQQLADGIIDNSKVAADAAIEMDKIEAGFIRKAGTVAFTGDQSMGSHKLTNLTNGSEPSDAATLSQLQAVEAGIYLKDTCRVATNVALSAYTRTANQLVANANGALNDVGIDGITNLALNDRVLIKNGAANVDNGLYSISDLGSADTPWKMDRTVDANADAEVKTGLTAYIGEGTALSGDFWTIDTIAPITLNTTGITFIKTGGTKVVTAGNGLAQSGNTVNVVATDASILVADNSLKVQLDATAGTIALGGVGIQIADATAGQILVGQGTGTDTAFKTLSGDGTLSSAGALSLASTVLKEADFVYEEVPTGTMNGSNVEFTLANTPIAGKVVVFLNGQRLRSGGNDYGISGGAITMVVAPVSTDVILIDYQK